MTAVRFGLPGGRGSRAAADPDSFLVQARTAEQLGFDVLWLAEHHAVPAHAAWAPASALVLAAAVAATIRRIRIGFAALSLRRHHPERLAQDLATLDVLSGGRVEVGVDRTVPGPGDPDACLDAVLARWSASATSGRGTGTGPVQRPHPPILTTDHDDASIAWAAARGYALVQPAVHADRALAHCLDRYAAHGGDVRTCPVERFCFVAETDAQAHAQAGPLVAELLDRLRRDPAVERPHPLTTAEDLEPERFAREIALVGGPETVAARIAALRDEHGVHRVNLRPSLTGLCPLPLQRRTVALFAEQVVPALAAAPAGRR